MKKLNFAICDREASYACKLMNYMTRRQQAPFEILVFSEIESLRLFVEEHPVELLLISSELICDDVREMDVRQTIILSEGERAEKYQDYPAVYKYQSSDSLVAEVMNYYAGEAAEQAPLYLKRNAQILGIYSPVGRCGKTCFALTLGQLLARRGPTLYLNLENFSGFENLMGKEFPADFSDMMYFIRQNRGSVIFKMNAMLQHLGDLAYVPPACSSGDLTEVKTEEWLRMLDAVTSIGGYESVLLDMDGPVEERIGLLCACTKIYTPVCGSVTAQAKITQYEKLLKELEYEELLERTDYLQLPFAEPQSVGEYAMEQLVNGEMGEFVRELLIKESGVQNGWSVRNSGNYTAN